MLTAIHGVSEALSKTFCVLSTLMLSFFGLIVTEVLIFTSLFWCNLYYSASTGIVSSMLMLLDPVGCSIIITLVLSSAGLSLALNYCHSNNYLSLGMAILCALLFVSLQVREFRSLGVYLNEFSTICLFYTLTGLHCSHVILGAIMLSMILGSFTSLAVYVPFMLGPSVTAHVITCPILVGGASTVSGSGLSLSLIHI